MTVGWGIIDPDYLIRRYIKGAEGFNESRSIIRYVIELLRGAFHIFHSSKHLLQYAK